MKRCTNLLLAGLLRLLDGDGRAEHRVQLLPEQKIDNRCIQYA